MAFLTPNQNGIMFGYPSKNSDLVVSDDVLRSGESPYVESPIKSNLENKNELPKKPVNIKMNTIPDEIEEIIILDRRQYKWNLCNKGVFKKKVKKGACKKIKKGM